MKLHNEIGDSLEPCKHMETMLNRTAEGSAPPLMKWYAKSHAKGCDRCGTFLTRVTNLLTQLKDIKSEEIENLSDDHLTKERWETLEARWKEVEK